ncbi:hypothetical protein DSECCO2_561310 [anaerobic digester metagenome]
MPEYEIVSYGMVHKHYRRFFNSIIFFINLYKLAFKICTAYEITNFPLNKIIYALVCIVVIYIENTVEFFIGINQVVAAVRQQYSFIGIKYHFVKHFTL